MAGPVDGTHVHARRPDGQTAWMLCTGGDVSHTHGGEQGAGWCAPVYGQLAPTSTTVRLATDAHTPFVLVTWVGSGTLVHTARSDASNRRTTTR